MNRTEQSKFKRRALNISRIVHLPPFESRRRKRSLKRWPLLNYIKPIRIKSRPDFDLLENENFSSFPARIESICSREKWKFVRIYITHKSTRRWMEGRSYNSNRSIRRSFEYFHRGNDRRGKERERNFCQKTSSPRWSKRDEGAKEVSIMLGECSSSRFNALR